jgi:nicotinate-nucleotide adenylyltransferase
MEKGKQIALYFGTFNPIHVGHLAIANHIALLKNVDEVWLIVSPQNPLKKKSTMLADYHRLAIVREAIAENDKLRVSDIEFSMPKPSYTVDTLTYISEKHPDYQFSIIMGEDNLHTFANWKNYKIILEDYRIYVYPRINTEYDLINKGKSDMEITGHPNIFLLEDVPMMNISSSFIRNIIREGKSPTYLLTPPVLKYVEEMHFYEK